MHTRLQDFGSFSTDLLSDLKLIEQQQNKVSIVTAPIVWLDPIYILAMNPLTATSSGSWNVGVAAIHL